MEEAFKRRVIDVNIENTEEVMDREMVKLDSFFAAKNGRVRIHDLTDLITSIPLEIMNNPDLRHRNDLIFAPVYTKITAYSLRGNVGIYKKDLRREGGLESQCRIKIIDCHLCPSPVCCKNDNRIVLDLAPKNIHEFRERTCMIFHDMKDKPSIFVMAAIQKALMTFLFDDKTTKLSKSLNDAFNISNRVGTLLIKI